MFKGPTTERRRRSLPIELHLLAVILVRGFQTISVLLALTFLTLVAMLALIGQLIWADGLFLALLTSGSIGGFLFGEWVYGRLG